MRGTPRAACQSRHGSADGQIQAFDKCRLNATGEAQRTQRLPIHFGCAEIDVSTDFGYATPAVAFDHLGVEQLGGDSPDASVLPECLSPLPEVSRESIVVKRQAIAGEDG